MEPFVILVVVPALIGVAAELYYRDAKNASLAAALGSVLVVCLCVKTLDPDGGGNWLAGLMVSPLPIAFAVGFVLLCYGRSQNRRRKNGKRARAVRFG